MRFALLTASALLLLHPLSAAAEDSTPRKPSPMVVKAAEDFTQVAELANPWVVNISTTQYIRQRLGGFWEDFYGFDPFQGGTRTLKRQSLGSGFIYSPEGLILTNAHVVANADEIMVRLVDGTEAKAQVVGEDANVDLALLKIEVGHPLPNATLGDSSKVKVGQWAIAIGNPFGFDHSLTVGVISAKERTNIFTGEGAAKYQNYLQTDASINHGNSGGPLCDIYGEVIGMNTAISTPNEGSIGIGFAIPVNFIKRSVPDLLRNGRVVAPKLGFFTQDVDERLAQALKLPASSGVLVTDVASNGAADKAGLRRGDVLLSLNDKPVPNSAALRTRIYEADPGQTLLLKAWREGRAIELSVSPDQLKAGEDPGTWHGLRVINNSAEEAAKRGLAVPDGVIVDGVVETSSAARIGIKPGDVLMEINQKRIPNKAAWDALSKNIDEGQDAVLLLVRGRQSAYIVLPAEQ